MRPAAMPLTVTPEQAPSKSLRFCSLQQNLWLLAILSGQEGLKQGKEEGEYCHPKTPEGL